MKTSALISYQPHGSTSATTPGLPNGQIHIWHCSRTSVEISLLGGYCSMSHRVLLPWSNHDSPANKHFVNRTPRQQRGNRRVTTGTAMAVTKQCPDSSRRALAISFRLDLARCIRPATAQQERNADNFGDVHFSQITIVLYTWDGWPEHPSSPGNHYYHYFYHYYYYYYSHVIIF